MWPVLLELCLVGHRAPDTSLQYASGLFLVVCIDPVKMRQFINFRRTKDRKGHVSKAELSF